MGKNSHMSIGLLIYIGNWNRSPVSWWTRNPLWFNSITPKLHQIWDTILKERKEGSWKARLPQITKEERIMMLSTSASASASPSGPMFNHYIRHLVIDLSLPGLPVSVPEL